MCRQVRVPVYCLPTMKYPCGTQDIHVQLTWTETALQGHHSPWAQSQIFQWREMDDHQRHILNSLTYKDGIQNNIQGGGRRGVREIQLQCSCTWLLHRYMYMYKKIHDLFIFFPPSQTDMTFHLRNYNIKTLTMLNATGCNSYQKLLHFVAVMRSNKLSILLHWAG